MRYAIFGATGFVGAALARRLRDAGHDVWAPAREDGAWADRDLGHVVYAAGVTAGFRERPLDTAEAHVGLPAAILARGRFASFAYLSSARVYAGLAEGREDAALLVDPARPDAAYDLTKLAGEALCQATGRPEVRVVRLSNVVGPGLRPPNFVAAIAAEARATGRILLRQAAGSRKDYVALDDVLDLLPRIATDGRERLYNVASGMLTTHAEVAAAFGVPVEVAPGAPLVTFPPIATGRVRAEFAFQPRPLGPALAALRAASPGGAAPC